MIEKSCPISTCSRHRQSLGDLISPVYIHMYSRDGGENKHLQSLPVKRTGGWILTKRVDN